MTQWNATTQPTMLLSFAAPVHGPDSLVRNWSASSNETRRPTRAENPAGGAQAVASHRVEAEAQEGRHPCFRTQTGCSAFGRPLRDASAGNLHWQGQPDRPHQEPLSRRRPRPRWASTWMLCLPPLEDRTSHRRPRARHLPKGMGVTSIIGVRCSDRAAAGYDDPPSARSSPHHAVTPQTSEDFVFRVVEINSTLNTPSTGTSGFLLSPSPRVLT
jgi:hypothetical protein